MNNKTIVADGIKTVSDDFVTNSLNSIRGSVKVYSKIYRDALAGLRKMHVQLTPEFEAALVGLEDIRVSVFVSTVSKAGVYLNCKTCDDLETAITIASVSKLSSILTAAYDNSDEGLIANKAGMFEPTLIKAINHPGEISMSMLIKICLASNIELSVK